MFKCENFMIYQFIVYGLVQSYTCITLRKNSSFSFLIGGLNENFFFNLINLVAYFKGIDPKYYQIFTETTGCVKRFKLVARNEHVRLGLFIILCLFHFCLLSRYCITNTL